MNDMTKLAITAGIIFAAWKFGSGHVRAAALAVGAVAVAKRVPYVQDVL